MGAIKTNQNQRFNPSKVCAFPTGTSTNWEERRINTDRRERHEQRLKNRIANVCYTNGKLVTVRWFMVLRVGMNRGVYMGF